MNIKTRILSAILTASLAFSTLAAPAFEISATAATSSYSSSYAGVPELNITDTSFINYTYGCLRFGSNYTWLYDFCDEMHTGFGNKTKKIAFVEMYYGIHAYVKNNSVYFKFYNNSKQNVVGSNPKLISDGLKTNLEVKNVTEYTKIDTSNMNNGLYAIEMTAVCKEKNINNTPVMYFYVNGDDTYLCSYTISTTEEMNAARERREIIEKGIKEQGVTPENSLSTENLYFPWRPSKGFNSIPSWVAFAKTIVKDEWSDSLKAFAIHEWMVKNIAYDYYKANVLDRRRDEQYNDFSGKYDMYYTKAGVCFDFSNVYAAMCRSVGVPAITVDVAPHTWNAVYIDGRWLEVDITVDVVRGIYEEDMTKVKIVKHSDPYKGYCSLKVNNSKPEKVNYWLVTY